MGLTEELADLMLEAQSPRDTRLALATEVIDNSGTPASRDQQLDQIHQTYLALATREQKHDKNPIGM